MLDYERLMSDPETAPFQYLHAGSTDHENYRFEFVPIPESADHDTHDDALERMLPRYLAPALDFFDAFLAGRGDPESVPRVRWHLPNVGWRESPVVAARRCTRAAPVSDGGGRSRPRPSPTRGRSSGCTIPRTWCPPPSRTRSPSSTSTPTRMRSPRGPTSRCSSRPTWPTT